MDLGTSARGRTTIDKLLRPDPICVVPKMIAPGRRHSKLQGAYQQTQNAQLGLVLLADYSILADFSRLCRAQSS